MSQQPATTTLPNGNAPNAAAQPPKLKRRPKQVTNPLVQKKPQGARPANTSRPAHAAQKTGAGKSATSPHDTGFRPDEYDDIPIVTTKGALLENLKHHIIRFLPNISAEQQVIDLWNEKQFQRPVRLHRRDPRANNLHVPVADQAEEKTPVKEGKVVDDKERERQQIAKAEKQAEREKLQADTAPTTKTTQPKKKKFRKHADQPHKYSDKLEKQELMGIRYEEKLPWHIEDFEDQQVWRGTYETALSQNHVALTQVPNPNGGTVYRMIPLEKWYKFTPKGQIENPLTFEEAEKAMQKGARDPLWLRRSQAAETLKRTGNTGASIFARKGMRGEQTTGPTKTEDDDEGYREAADDIDDIDYNYSDDFADDEEGPELVGQEEQEQAKEMDEKVKREMRDAPVFDIKEEKDFDAEEEAQKLKDIEERRIAKKTQKALMKREKNFAYEQDSDGNPYESEVRCSSPNGCFSNANKRQTSSEDSEAEREKEEERKQEEERKAAEGTSSTKGQKITDAIHSGASTKGTNTPVPGQRPKPNGPLRSALKRPGSPNLSDASGNESASRKKMKKKQFPSSTLGVGDGATISRTGTPANGMTMAAPQAQRPVRLNVDGGGAGGRVASGAGSGSDVEMSDGSRAGSVRKTKSKPGSPSGSRPGSPSAGGVKKMRKSLRFRSSNYAKSSLILSPPRRHQTSIF